MKLNEVSSIQRKPKRHRVGRGHSSGWGKTCKRGQKGQKARSGGKVKAGFEGGQTPLQRRVPKFGFTSQISLVTESVRLSELEKVEGNQITLKSLKDAGIVRKLTKRARIFLSGEITKAYDIAANISVSSGAKKIILEKNGKILP